MQQAQVAQWLQTKLRENSAQKNVSDAKWAKIEHRLTFIHDRKLPDEVWATSRTA